MFLSWNLLVPIFNQSFSQDSQCVSETKSPPPQFNSSYILCVCVCVCVCVSEGRGRWGSQQSSGLTKSILWCDKGERQEKGRREKTLERPWKDQKGKRRAREVNYNSNHISLVCVCVCVGRGVLKGSLINLWPTADSLVETVSKTQAVTSRWPQVWVLPSCLVKLHCSALDVFFSLFILSFLEMINSIFLFIMSVCLSHISIFMWNITLGFRIPRSKMFHHCVCVCVCVCVWGGGGFFDPLRVDDEHV